MKYALIGCGRISPNHIQAAINNKLEIVALCDIVEQNMYDLIDKFKLPDNVERYTSYEDMLKKEEIELVAIATESGKHAKIALDCIEQGINVIIEKPIALSIEDADKIINKAREKEILVCVNHQNRFNKAVRKTYSEIEMGHFGKLLHGTAHILWNRGKQYYEQAKWRGTWEQDGGTLMNQCIHNIDLLCWMMGEVDEVFAYTDNLKHDYIEAEDVGLAVIKFKNDGYGMIEGTSYVYPKNLEETLYIFGSEGTVKLGGKSVNTIEEWNIDKSTEDIEYVKEKYSENPPNVYGFGHTPLYEDVINSIINKREPVVTAEDGKRALEVVLAIYKSAQLGTPIKLPLKEGTTMDFVGRFNEKTY